MSEQQDILHCPFCGSEAKAYASHYANLGEHWVICLSPNCGGKTHWWASREQAIAAWNKRAGDADNRRLRKLERGLREVMDWPTSLDEVENPSERKIIAIGRLLEGEE